MKRLNSRNPFRKGPPVIEYTGTHTHGPSGFTLHNDGIRVLLSDGGAQLRSWITCFHHGLPEGSKIPIAFQSDEITVKVEVSQYSFSSIVKYEPRDSRTRGLWW